MEALDRTPTVPRRPRVLALVAVSGALALFLGVGLLGLYRYLDSFWLYRGFAPPHDPSFVQQAGTPRDAPVTSSAVGGRSQRVVVYLPPGYAQHISQRYPVLYLLHGFPGDPAGSFGRSRWGSSRTPSLAEPRRTDDPRHADGVDGRLHRQGVGERHRQGRGLGDVPRPRRRAGVDARYRTIRSGSARGLAGLSEGGYAALNIGIHHPLEFHLLESWSGYEQADDVKSIFGGRAPVLARNSPLLTLPRVARELRAEHTYVWMYTGSKDGLLKQNARFAGELARLRVAHRFFVV